jgi:hypothetical protein
MLDASILFEDYITKYHHHRNPFSLSLSPILRYFIAQYKQLISIQYFYHYRDLWKESRNKIIKEKKRIEVKLKI